MEKTENRNFIFRNAAVLLVGALGLAGCASGTSEEYSCTGDGRIKIEVVDDGTWPKRTLSSSIVEDVGGFCLDGEIDSAEAKQLS